MIRSYLGDEGYFLHCISCPLGDPFKAVKAFDSFRAGLDIDSGEWGYHVRSASWLLPAVLSSGKNTWFVNIDSCMGKPEIPDIERRSRLAFAYITAGMLEFAGPVEEFTLEMLADYELMCQRYEAGSGVLCPDNDAFYGRALPKVMLRIHEPESRTYNEFGIKASVALLNWDDYERVVGIPLSRLGLSSGDIALKDFWTGEPIRVCQDMISFLLPPRTHRLLDVLI